MVLSSCSRKTYDALEWENNKVTADGRIPEWDNPLRFYNDKSKLNYTISNDRRNLYVCMKISDETQQMKILRGGMEFKIDTSGKKTFATSFMFPLAGQPMQQRKREDSENGDAPERRQGEHVDRSAMKQKMASRAKEAQLIGFKSPLGGILPLITASSGISAAVNMDSLGILYYEAIIPFGTFYKNELTAADTNRVFNFEIKINAVPSPPMRQSGGGGGMPGGGMPGGGMGGMRGSGMGGMRGGGMRGGGGYSGNSELYVTNKVVTRMKLAVK